LPREETLRGPGQDRGRCVAGIGVLLLTALLGGCGDDSGGGLVKKSGEMGGEDGGGIAPPRPALPGHAAAAPAKATSGLAESSVKPPSAEEYARKRAQWEAFSRNEELASAAAGGKSGAAANAPLGAGLSAGMQRWYTDYSAVAASVKLALPRVTTAVSGGQPAEIASACTELRSATARLQGDPSALSSPDPAINKALRDTYSAYGAAAEACLAGRVQDRDARLAAANTAMRAATAALLPYQLKP
jgi:hypothetical protein